jgi:DNA-binding transcriptional regulator LsrR (DeoR family)
MGPAELVQAAAIAREYYLEGKAKTEIAEAHDLSRYKVARILETCMREGIVRIEIDTGAAVDAELSERLRSHFRLNHALVVAGPFAGPTELRAGLGRAAGDLLTEVLTDDDTLGVSWGRTLDAMAQQIQELPPCRIVQMTGIAGPVETSSVDHIRRLSAVSRGPHHPIYAPLVMSDPQALAALRRQAGIAAAMSRWPVITIAAVAVGTWNPSGAQVYASLTEADRAEIDAADVVAEICSIPFDAQGRPVRTSLMDRTMAIPYPDLERIPEVIAVAGGLHKTEAIRSVLHGRVVTSLVTDADVATRLLADGPLPTEAVPRRPAGHRRRPA